MIAEDERLTVLNSRNVFWGNKQSSTLSELAINDKSQNYESNLYQVIKYKIKKEITNSVFLTLPCLPFKLREFDDEEMKLEQAYDY